MKQFTVIHSSSKYNRSAATLRRAMAKYRQSADIIFLTEVNREYREDALEADGWGVSVGDKSGWDDCGIVWNKQTFKLLHRESFNMGGGGRYCQIAVFRDLRNNKVLVTSAAHDPSSVETELSRRQRTADSALWTKGVWSRKRRLNTLRRQFSADAVLNSSDWNVNFERQWVRTLIKSIHPVWKNAWVKYVGPGTHGNRFIDAILYRGKLALKSATRLFGDDESSDHRPIVTTFVWV